MTILLAFLVVALFTIRRLAPGVQTLAWSGALLGLLFLLLFSLQHVFGFTEFFISDERLYVSQGREAPVGFGRDRYLWFLLNIIVFRHDWPLGGVPLKLINLPLLAITVSLLWRIFRRNDLILLMPVVLPYIAYTAIFNLRDVGIYFTTTLFVYFIEHQNPRLQPASLLPLTGLYLLRPLMAVFIVALYVFLKALSGVTILKAGRLPRRGWLTLLGVVALFAIVQAPLRERLHRYHIWFEYITAEGFEARVAERGIEEQYVSGSWPRRIGIGAIRYTLTPIPSSLLRRMLVGEAHQWGPLDDLVRFFHQGSYYFGVLYLLVRFRTLAAVIRSLRRREALMLLALLSYMPIYSFYHFGVTHQRTKIPFQMAVFVLAALVHQQRSKIER